MLSLLLLAAVKAKLGIAPLLIAAIGAAAHNIFGAISSKKKANSAQDLEAKQYADQVAAYMEEQNKAEDQRQNKVRLMETFARANNLDSALTPEMIGMLMKRRDPTAPPPYRKAGTPGFVWDMASIAADSAASIWGASKTKTPKSFMPKMDPKLMLPASVPAGMGSPFGSSVKFGSGVTWGNS